MFCTLAASETLACSRSQGDPPASRDELLRFLFLLASTGGFFRLWLGGMMGRSLVMCSLGMRSLVMCSLGMRSSLVMCSLGMRSLVVHSTGVHSGGVFAGGGLNHDLRMAMIHRVVLVPIISSF